MSQYFIYIRDLAVWREIAVWYRKQSSGCHVVNSINGGLISDDLISPVSTRHPTWARVARVWVSAVRRSKLYTQQLFKEIYISTCIGLRLTRCHSRKILIFWILFSVRKISDRIRPLFDIWQAGFSKNRRKHVWQELGERVNKISRHAETWFRLCEAVAIYLMWWNHAHKIFVCIYFFFLYFKKIPTNNVLLSYVLLTRKRTIVSGNIRQRLSHLIKRVYKKKRRMFGGPDRFGSKTGLAGPLPACQKVLAWKLESYLMSCFGHLIQQTRKKRTKRAMESMHKRIHETNRHIVTTTTTCAISQLQPVIYT